jgi:hypothetical protein
MITSVEAAHLTLADYQEGEDATQLLSTQQATTQAPAASRKFRLGCFTVITITVTTRPHSEYPKRSQMRMRRGTT